MLIVSLAANHQNEKLRLAWMSLVRMPSCSVRLLRSAAELSVDASRRGGCRSEDVVLDEDRLHELVGVEELTSSVSVKALHAYPDRCWKVDEAVERLHGVVLLA